MALCFVEREPYEIRKLENKFDCVKCGDASALGWSVKDYGFPNTTKNYCYGCTRNQWKKALSIYLKGQK